MAKSQEIRMEEVSWAQIHAVIAQSKQSAQEAKKKRLEAGKLLVYKKAQVSHGEWLPQLKREGISEDKAERLIKAYRVFIGEIVPEIPQAAEFDGESDAQDADKLIHRPNDTEEENDLFAVDISFSQFVEAVRDHAADEYLKDIRSKLQKAVHRKRFKAALIAAKTWIDEVLAGIEQLNQEGN